MPQSNLQIIVDPAKLDMERPGVSDGLERDLERIRVLIGSETPPSGANAVQVIPTTGMYAEAINYELQYGIKEKDKAFVPIGPSKEYPHETLPYL